MRVRGSSFVTIAAPLSLILFRVGQAFISTLTDGLMDMGTITASSIHKLKVIPFTVNNEMADQRFDLDSIIQANRVVWPILL
ncbi:unnamed protein product [Leptosia nina]|uniref:Uncharacterized protein n=1 Tax=Leptosia nina TaxID=320188 RepID=A0AAV1K4E1_9NEOP